MEDINIYAMAFEDDIVDLIEAIKNVRVYTPDGTDVKNELLNKLYNETL